MTIAEQTSARVIFGNDLRLPIDLKLVINPYGGRNANFHNNQRVFIYEGGSISQLTPVKTI